MSTVIHLSDGDTSVQTLHSPDTFTLVTHKNEYKWVDGTGRDLECDKFSCFLHYFYATLEYRFL